MLTDYLFYYKYLIHTPEFIATGISGIQNAMKIVFTDYDRVNNIIVPKYNLDLSSLPQQTQHIDVLKPKILNENDVLKFIDFCGNINIVKAFDKIKNKNLEFDFELKEFPKKSTYKNFNG